MSGIVSRWPVVVSLPVGADERDDEGRLTEAAVERLFAEVRAAYFEQCTTVDRSALEVRETKVRVAGEPVGDAVTVSASVVEVFPDSFTMNARIRPGEGGEVAAEAWCSLSPGGEVTKPMRDEFIALAHAATHFH